MDVLREVNTLVPLTDHGVTVKLMGIGRFSVDGFFNGNKALVLFDTKEVVVDNWRFDFEEGKLLEMLVEIHIRFKLGHGYAEFGTAEYGWEIFIERFQRGEFRPTMTVEKPVATAKPSASRTSSLASQISAIETGKVIQR